MPATIPSHQAAVLPIKLAWPRRVDGIALVIGSVAPDLAYAFYPWWPFGSTHDPGSLLWWSAPVAAALALIVRYVALPHAALCLPDLGRWHLRDYATSADVPFRPVITAASALLGAATHVGWDYFTHPGDLTQWIPGLLAASPLGPPWYKVLQYGGGALGLIVTLWCVTHIGRHRLLLRWHGTVPGPARYPTLWWTVALGVAAPLAVSAVTARDAEYPHILVNRGLWIAMVASVVAGAVVAVRRRRPRSVSSARVVVNPSR